MQLPAFFVLFFLSGIAGLIYESIWSHYLKLFLGHAAYSQTLVLVIYMGGMAAGAWIAGMKLKKIQNLLAAYAIVEGCLGIAALLFHDLFLRYLQISYDMVIPSLNRSYLILGYKWLTASIIILPQSILLGATFPLMAAGFIRRFPGSSGYKISFLYFTNTLGASLGVLVSGFYLIDKTGLKGAIVAGGIIDVFVGVSVLLLCRKCPIIEETVVFEPPEKPAVTKKNYYLPLLIISGATAAASFMYEIGWIRMLSLVLGSSTHSFELMLSAFIFGMALGSFFIRKKIDQITNIPRTIVLAQVIMGICALVTIFTYGRMFEFMKFTINALAKNEHGYFLFNIFSHFICLLIMLPSTICAGMVLPLIIHLFYRDGHGEESVGKVYAINTFGGIVGVIIAVWFLMPLLGVGMLITIGGAIDIFIGLYILLRFEETGSSRLKNYLPAFCGVCLSITIVFGRIDPVLVSSGVYRNGYIVTGKKIISNKDGKTATVTLFKNSRCLVLTTNGKPDASVNIRGGISGDEYTMALAAVLPLAAGRDSSTAAIIGMGSGMTAHYMLYDTTLKNVDVIEIEPAMVEAAKKIGEKVANTFSDKRCHTYIDDAKTFFSAHNRKYDIIVSEPSNPWVSGVSGLFSEEFFGRIKNHLNEHGILVQWFHKYESDVSILVSIFNALRMHFPNYCMYMAGSDLITLASTDTSLDLSLKRDVFNFSPLTTNLEQMGFNSVEDFTVLRFATENVIGPLCKVFNFPPNSDYYPFVDLNAVKYRFTDEYIHLADTLRKYIIPVRKILESDTGLISSDIRENVPDLKNFKDFNMAKILYKELKWISSDSSTIRFPYDRSKEIIALDYASKNPDKVTFEQLFSSLCEIIEQTIPNLSASEMRDIISIIEKKVAAMELTSDDKVWVDYFRALCLYDMKSLLAHSKELLAAESEIECNYLNQFLLTSLFISAYKTGDTTGIESYWNHYEGKNKPDVMTKFTHGLIAGE